nr:RpiB/LacA/LacB family sugar-phosphate isomerase [Streptomyces sp. NA02950]
MHALLRIAVGADPAGRQYASTLTGDLCAHPLVDFVIDVNDSGDPPPAYPEVALAAAQLVAEGLADRALLVCHTGLGMAIAANKVHGIRAVTAHDLLSVQASVECNNAQVLTLGQGVVGITAARRLVAAWVTFRCDFTAPAAAKVSVITEYENRASRPAATR